MNRARWGTAVIMTAAFLAAVAVSDRVPAGSPPAGWLSKEEVTPARVKALCQALKWEVSDIDGGLRVVDQDRRIILVIWEEKKELIYFALLYKMKRDLPAEGKLRLVNSINNNIVFTRAFIDEEGDLEFDYSLRYKDGLSEAQILNSLRYFVEASLGAIKEEGVEAMLQ